MKKIKYLLTMLLVVAFALMSFGCYMISSQKMYRLKGSYELTGYSRTEAKTNKVTDYIIDGYKTYLVITGEGKGYFAHKDNNTATYAVEVSLTYEYDQEQTDKIAYVSFNTALSSQPLAWTKFGVARDSLNFSRPAINVLNGSDGLSISWKKVDKATDLSYVEEELGTLKKYGYQDFSARGIYEWDVSTDITTGEALENEYQYYYIVVDTANGVTTANISYALKETPTVREDRTVVLSHTAGDWNSMTIDGVVWTIDPTWGNCYYSEVDGVKRQISNRSNDISSARLDELIAGRLPMEVN
jgi:hypothetical protein